MKINEYKNIYQNVECFQRCYGCNFSTREEDAIHPAVVKIEISESGGKRYRYFLTHDNKGCISMANKKLCAKFGSEGLGILEDLVVKKT